MTNPNIVPTEDELQKLLSEIEETAQTDKYQMMARAELVRNEAIGADKSDIDALARGIVGYEVKLLATSS